MRKLAVEIALILALLGLLLFFLPGVSRGATSCHTPLFAAARALADQELTNYSIFAVVVAKIHDIRCEQPEHMANVLIVVMGADKSGAPKKLYGIFHLHFLPNGQRPMGAAFTNPRWKEATRDDGSAEKMMSAEWCEAMRLAYPSGPKPQEC